jgi:hypothetical protein
MSSRRQSSGRRRHSESCCMRCRTVHTILVGSFFLSVLQGLSLRNIIAIYAPEDVIKFDAIYQCMEQDLPKFLPIQSTQSDSMSLSTFATPKHYEMARVTALALDEQQPKRRPKSYKFMDSSPSRLWRTLENGENSPASHPWLIPNAGGTIVHEFVASCLGLRVASNIGTLFGHANDRTLQPIDTPSTFTY